MKIKSIATTCGGTLLPNENYFKSPAQSALLSVMCHACTFPPQPSNTSQVYRCIISLCMYTESSIYKTITDLPCDLRTGAYAPHVYIILLHIETRVEEQNKENDTQVYMTYVSATTRDQASSASKPRDPATCPPLSSSCWSCCSSCCWSCHSRRAGCPTGTSRTATSAGSRMSPFSDAP